MKVGNEVRTVLVVGLLALVFGIRFQQISMTLPTVATVAMLCFAWPLQGKEGVAVQIRDGGSKPAGRSEGVARSPALDSPMPFGGRIMRGETWLRSLSVVAIGGVTMWSISYCTLAVLENLIASSDHKVSEWSHAVNAPSGLTAVSVSVAISTLLFALQRKGPSIAARNTLGIALAVGIASLSSRYYLSLNAERQILWSFALSRTTGTLVGGLLMIRLSSLWIDGYSGRVVSRT